MSDLPRHCCWAASNGPILLARPKACKQVPGAMCSCTCLYSCKARRNACRRRFICDKGNMEEGVRGRVGTGGGAPHGFSAVGEDEVGLGGVLRHLQPQAVLQDNCPPVAPPTAAGTDPRSAWHVSSTSRGQGAGQHFAHGHKLQPAGERQRSCGYRWVGRSQGRAPLTSGAGPSYRAASRKDPWSLIAFRFADA